MRPGDAAEQVDAAALGLRKELLEPAADVTAL
jgi:hypothetical protein